MNPGFIHLHIHSDYSLVDSTIRLPDKPDYGDPAKAVRPNLISRAVEMRLPALALTDAANMFALVKFQRAAEANGIKPIAGVDLWIADAADANRPTRLTVLCRDRTGYLHLSRLISRSYGEGRLGEFAQTDPAWFADHADGLIVLAGRDSDVGRLLRSGQDDAARVRLRAWQALFGDCLYLEITRVGHADETLFNIAALRLASEFDCPIVATNDVRFATRDDFEAHEARVCIQTGRQLADPKRPRDYTPEQYLKSAEEMAQLFADLPEALENSVEIAKRCNLELSFGTYYLPEFPVPAAQTVDSFIRERAREGLARRLSHAEAAPGYSHDSYAHRLETELDVIAKMGFPGYFLIVADFINWAKQHGIPVGPGRGSGAGSLVAWSLGITDIDPLRYGLLFERFLNPERVSMPDFDVDFCMDRRDEVIDYVAHKYGRDKVSQIITYGTMAAKAVLRDAGRVLGLGYGRVDQIAKLIPLRPTDPLSLEDALGRSSAAREDSNRIISEFKALYETDDEVHELVDLALKLEDLIRNAGKHAGGVVIAPSALSDFAPLYCESAGAGMVTQFDKDDVEAIGLVKFDFLGLRTLTIIDWTVKAVNAQRPESGKTGAHAGSGHLDISRIPLDDPQVFDLFRRAQTVAIFQFESRGMQAMLKEALPDRFEDLMALTSLFRPGPMEQIPSFCKRKHGTEPIDYPDERVKPVLAETYGIMVYQEQVMQMAQIVGGYTLGGADLLRRAMGKKNAAEMARQRAVFRDGAATNGLDAHQADAIFDLMEKFAGYGFNKSHAAAYALVSYQTAWLKVHYPAHFMAAVLSADMDNTDKVVVLLNEVRALGLAVLAPDVNASGYAFQALVGTDRAMSIRYGLGAVKGVGHGAAESVVAARIAGGPFTDLADFCQRVDSQKLNKRVLEALILCGAMDGLGANRASLMAQLPDALRAAEQAARDAAAGQNDMFGAASTTPAAALPAPVVPEWPPEQRLAGERDTLGHYLSGHPTALWRDTLTQLATCPIGEIGQRYTPPKPRAEDDGNRFRRAPETPWIVAGQVVDVRKRGDSQAFVQIEDWSGRIEVSLYREAFVEFAPLLTRDAILVVEGGLAWDDFSGGLRVRARRVLTLNDACEHGARVLRIRLNGVDARFSETLRGAISGYRGGHTPLRLHYKNAQGDAVIELGADWRVRATADLKRSLDALPGVKSTEWVMGKTTSQP